MQRGCGRPQLLCHLGMSELLLTNHLCRAPMLACPLKRPFTAAALTLSIGSRAAQTPLGASTTRFKATPPAAAQIAISPPCRSLCLLTSPQCSLGWFTHPNTRRRFTVLYTLGASLPAATLKPLPLSSNFRKAARCKLHGPPPTSTLLPWTPRVSALLRRSLYADRSGPGWSSSTHRRWWTRR